VSAYEVVHLDELERLPVDDEGLLWRPLRRRIGLEAFGSNAWTAAKAGDRVVEEHEEKDGHEELYFVASGRATFTLGDEEIDAPTGSVIFAPPGTKRGAIAAEPDTTVVVFGAKPGVPHEVSEWEDTFAAYAYLKLGDEEQGRKAIESALERDTWRSHYHAACFESLSGNPDQALEHLLRAVELDAKAREWAQDDRDLDSIRDRPEFPA
jgi:mannose-6-phosphate isomerase-like protein (cupin superfamily)